MRKILDHPAALGNFKTGRKRKIDMLILHVMEGGFKPTGKWFATPDARVSAHYGISVDGAVAQYVLDSDTAWHAGHPVYNARSIGIELEGHCADPDAFTPAMMEALGELADLLCGEHGIARNREHVIGHCEVPDPRHAGSFGGAGHHTDPGPHFPWEAFITGLERKAIV